MIILNLVTRLEFDALKENVKVFQDNIDKNITWFYAALAIVVAVLIVGLIVVVRASISRGIQKGIEKKSTELIETIKNDIGIKILGYGTAAPTNLSEPFKITLSKGNKKTPPPFVFVIPEQGINSINVIETTNSDFTVEIKPSGDYPVRFRWIAIE